MRELLKILVLGAFCFTAVGEVKPEDCAPSVTYPTSGLQLGLGAVNLLPNGLSGFSSPVLGFGPLLGWSFGSTVLQLRASLGGTSQIQLGLGELAIHFVIPNPYFKPHIILGAHGLAYTDLSLNQNFTHWGGNLGYGLSFGATESLSVLFALNLYFQQRILVGVSGTILW